MSTPNEVPQWAVAVSRDVELAYVQWDNDDSGMDMHSFIARALASSPVGDVMRAAIALDSIVIDAGENYGLPVPGIGEKIHALRAALARANGALAAHDAKEAK